MGLTIQQHHDRGLAKCFLGWEADWSTIGEQTHLGLPMDFHLDKHRAFLLGEGGVCRVPSQLQAQASLAKLSSGARRGSQRAAKAPAEAFGCAVLTLASWLELSTVQA